MSLAEKKKQILQEVILGYRKELERRYDYDHILKVHDLPESFDEEKIKLFHTFFLSYLYPEPVKRVELNEAFECLDNFIKQPDKLIRLVLDSTSLIFKYGRHLPKILKSGIKAMRSFREANAFERRLVNSAVRNKIEPPFEGKEIDQLIGSLSREDLESFIISTEDLFATLHDRTLIKKIKEIVKNLIEKMKAKPDIYSETEVKGMELGEELLREGDYLFEQLSPADQKELIKFVVNFERENINRIFKERN